MPKNITKIDDYKGFTSLPIGDVETFFNQFSFDVEENILRGDGGHDFGLLGDQVYVAMIADLDGNNNPQNAPYINLINGVNYTANNGRTVIFIGIKKMLTYFVYSEYVKRNKVTLFQSNAVKMKYENADQASNKEINYEAHRRWNKGVSLYNHEVYDYLLFNQSSFTNWEFTRSGKFLTKGII